MTATRNKRILSVQPVCDGGGSEHALVRMLRQLTADGWDCHVAVPGPARLAAEYAAAGATLHVVPMRPLTTSGPPSRWLGYVAGWPVSVARLARMIRSLDVTLVHSNSLHCWYGWAAAGLTGRPHVWHAREIVFQSRAALALERGLTRRFASRVVAVSAAVAAQLDGADVMVVRDDADPAEFHPGRAGRFRPSAGVPDGVPVIGSVARIDTWKGFEVLLDAFPAVAAARSGTQLVVAGGTVPGKEGYAERLRQRAESLPGVHWLGARSDVPDLMADLDLFVQVSTEPEPFGLVVVEALASGVRVVAGAAGGPLEILGPAAVAAPSDLGVLVEPGDPDRLAAAILAVLPAAGSTAAERQARRPRREPAPGPFAPVFDEVLEVSARPRRGRARPGPRPPRPG